MWRSSEDGRLRIQGQGMKKLSEEKEVLAEDLVEEGEEVFVESKEGEKEKEGKKSEEGSIHSGTTVGYGFLEEIEDEEKDEELESKDKENRKRKGREDKMTMQIKGLGITLGWKERAEAGRGEERWKREVETDENGIKEVKKEKILLPESFDMGRDGRGMGMNSSARKNHNFWANKNRYSRKKGEVKEKGGTGWQTLQEEDAWDTGM